jgi:hypothetical protein
VGREHPPTIAMTGPAGPAGLVMPGHGNEFDARADWRQYLQGPCAAFARSPSPGPFLHKRSRPRGRMLGHFGPAYRGFRGIA